MPTDNPVIKNQPLKDNPMTVNNPTQPVKNQPTNQTAGQQQGQTARNAPTGPSQVVANVPPSQQPETQLAHEIVNGLTEVDAAMSALQNQLEPLSVSEQSALDNLRGKIAALLAKAGVKSTNSRGAAVTPDGSRISTLSAGSTAGVNNPVGTDKPTTDKITPGKAAPKTLGEPIPFPASGPTKPPVTAHPEAKQSITPIK